MSGIVHELSVAVSIDEVAEKLHLELQTAILITKVTQSRQYVLAVGGFNLPEIYRVSMPLDLSICQHTVAMDFPLVINNTITHPLLRDNRAFAELNIVSYLGAPVHANESDVSTGTICAVDQKERHWSEDDVAIIVLAAKACDRIFQVNNNKK
jgi:GAF domain-containing protein